MPSCIASRRGGHSLGSSARGEGGENVFWEERNGTEGNVERVLDGIENCGSGTVHRKFTDSFGAKRAVNVAQFFKIDADGREIGGGRHNIVGHLAILHAAVVPNHFFVKGKANGLRYAADDLSLRENRVKDFSNFLKRNKIIDRHAVSSEVYRNLRDVDGPGKRGIRLATVLFIVPENAFGLFILREAAEFAVLCSVVAAGGAELFGGVGIGECAACSQGLLDAEGGGLH